MLMSIEEKQQVLIDVFQRLVEEIRRKKWPNKNTKRN
jgi:predicted Fe-S protein YdhL (DUF1289 family)